MRSPIDELGEDLVHGGVLLTLLVNDLLDDLVLVADLVKVLAGGLRLDIGLVLVYKSEEKKFVRSDDIPKENLLVAISL